MQRTTHHNRHSTCLIQSLESRQMMSVAGTYLGTHTAPSNGVAIRDVAATRGGIVIGVGRQNNNAVVEEYVKGSTAASSFFGNHGVTTLPVLASYAFATATNVMVQPDDRILVTGYVQQSNTKNNQQWFVARLTDAGKLDSSFGMSGVAFVSGMHTNSSPTAFALQADGKIVVTGSWQVGSYYRDFVTARLTAAGKLDTGFGDKAGALQAGFVVTSLASDDVANDVALQADGKIVVAGVSTYGHDRPAAARYTTAGKLDSTFDGDGKIVTDELHNAGYQSVAIDGNSIYFAGSLQSLWSTYRENELLLRKYNSVGKVDATFGKFGTVTDLPNNVVTYRVSDVYVPKSGQVMVSGSIDDITTTTTKLITSMYSGSGVKDLNFGSKGSLTLSGSKTDPTLTQTAVTYQGTVLISSGNTIAELSEAQVMLFATNGSIGEEGGATAYFDIVRDGTYNFPTQVNFTVTGSAKADVDYTSLISTKYAIIPAGTSTLRIYAFPTDDSNRESTESIIVTFMPGSYKTANAGTSMLITDNDFAAPANIQSIASSLFSETPLLA